MVITYFQGPQGPLYRKSSAEADPSWYIYDGLGSVVGEVNAAGSVTASELYDAYGARRGYSGTPTTSQGFVGGLGQETDSEIGLIYMRARYYDPGTGRFASEDPKHSGENWYAYCDDDPVNRYDATGEDGESLIGALFLGIMTLLGYGDQMEVLNSRFAKYLEIFANVISCRSFLVDSLKELEEVTGAGGDSDKGGAAKAAYTAVCSSMSFILAWCVLYQFYLLLNMSDSDLDAPGWHASNL